MRIEEIIQNIFHLKFKKQTRIGATFVRFQEYFQSPEFRGKIFALDEYKDWYIANSSNGRKTGSFTYYNDFEGFTIPSCVLMPFYQGRFDPLSEEEKILLNLFEDIKSDNFCIIGTSEDSDTPPLKHEIAHGFWFTNDGYRENALNIVNQIDVALRKSVNNYFLNSAGYHCATWDNETHAFFIDSLDDLEEEGISTKLFLRARDELNILFDKHSKPYCQML